MSIGHWELRSESGELQQHERAMKKQPNAESKRVQSHHWKCPWKAQIPADLGNKYFLKHLMNAGRGNAKYNESFEQKFGKRPWNIHLGALKERCLWQTRKVQILSEPGSWYKDQNLHYSRLRLWTRILVFNHSISLQVFASSKVLSWVERDKDTCAYVHFSLYLYTYSRHV